MIELPLRAWRKAQVHLRLGAAASDADAFLASYPKSGRTWFRFILSNYFDITAGLGLQVDLHSMFAVLPNFDMDPQRGVPAFRFREHAGMPFVLVTHRAYKRSLFRGRPVIFMIRDPRDVLVSAYFHATRHKHRFSGSISRFLTNDEQGLPALIRYLNGWGSHLSHHPHMLLSYERLTADTEGATAAALSFLGCPVDPAAVKQSVEVSRFEAMREHEKQEGIPAHDYDRDDDESLRMRRGKAGGFADYLSQDDIQLIETGCAAALNPSARRLVAETGFNF